MSSFYKISCIRNVRLLKPTKLLFTQNKHMANDSLERAYSYFNSEYPKIVGDKWAEVSECFKKTPLYAAVINRLIDSTSLVAQFEKLGANDIGKHYTELVEKESQKASQEERKMELKPHDTIDFVNVIKNVAAVKWPGELKAYSFFNSEPQKFPNISTACKEGFFTHYNLNVSSLLPVILLDVIVADYVLDLCAAPGGKSFTILQTGLPDSMTMNDPSESRLSRLRNLLRQSAPTDNYKYAELLYKRTPGEKLQLPAIYDKVLVDAPCLNDRISATEPDNNIFRKNRRKELENLPQMQSGILQNALSMVKRGGSVVYSTCTMRPEQNEGVVMHALRQSPKFYAVEDVSETIRHLQFLFHFTPRELGTLVYPTRNKNAGPMYICKIRRL